MNKLMVLKDVAYAAKTGGGTITGYKDADALAPGAIAFLDDKGALITSVNAETTVNATKYFTAIVGRTGDTLIVPIIPREKISLTKTASVAAVKPVYTLGGTASGTTLPFTSTGEVTIDISDSTLTNRHFTRSVRVSVTKLATNTNENFVDKVVAKINAFPNSFVTAAKVKDGGSTYFGITITPKENNVSLQISTVGMWEGYLASATTALVHSVGTGADILQLEKDFSVEEGNGNYIDYTEAHYKRAFEANASANYDLVDLVWEGTHSSPSRSHNVMINRLAIACVKDASDQDADEIYELLDAIIGEFIIHPVLPEDLEGLGD